MNYGVTKKTIKNLLGGVSQQPPLQRLENQCEEMINCIPSITEFLKRRNGTYHIGQIAYSENMFIETIKRSDTEFGIVTVNKSGGVSVYSLDGKQIGQTVTNTYLASDNPKKDIKLCTIRDYNFLLNTKKKVIAEKTTTPPVSNKYIVFIKQASYDQEYTIKVGNKVFTYETPKTDDGGKYILSAERIADSLVALMKGQEPTTKKYSRVYECDFNNEHNNLAPAPPHRRVSASSEYLDETKCGVTMEVMIQHATQGWVECTGRLHLIGYQYEGDDLIYDTPPKEEVATTNKVYANKGIIVIETSEKVTTYDGYGDTCLSVFKDKCYSISELPIYAPNGYIFQVVGDVTNHNDDYYIQFETEEKLSTGTIGRGGWKEIAKQGQGVGFNNSTLPLVLKINTNNITIEKIDWAKRKAGDVDTNPLPSFVNKTIKDIFFYKNRLGFITNESIIFSEAGEFFNFFQTTALALIESDPIDVSVSGTKADTIKYVLPYAEGLFLYTDASMYVLEHGETLSTSSVAVKPVLQFGTDLSAKPVVCDTSIYYAGNKGGYCQMREYKPNDSSDVYGYSNNITSHIPRYIKGSVSKIALSLEDGMMFLINETDSIYCYNFIKEDNQLLQSAWHKWVFGGTVLYGEMIKGYLYLVIKRDSGTFLEKLSISYPDTNYMDRYGFSEMEDYNSNYTFSTYFIRRNDIVYDIACKLRTITLKYNAGSDFRIEMKRLGRKAEVGNIDTRRDWTRFLLLSDNKNIQIAINSKTEKPFNIIEADIEYISATRS